MTGSPRPVVISTRPERSARFERVLTSSGIGVEHVPLIAITDPADWSDTDRAIRGINAYDGVLLTSANAVRRFFSRMRDLLGGVPSMPPLHAVGARTAEALTPFGLDCATVLDSGGARNMASRLGDVAGLRFLQPASSLARSDLRDTLEGLGAAVDVVTVYRTVPAPKEKTARLKALLDGGTVRAVAFFSPSAVREFVQLMGGDLPAGILYAAIGDTTAAALREAGLQAHIVAETQTADDLAIRIASHVQSQP